MAKMHTRRKGSSRSRPPFRESSPEWCDIGKEELEKHIIKLHESGLPSNKIGLILRDQYGVPNAKLILGKNITHFLRENAEVSDLPEDLTNLMRKALRIRKHMKNNHKDVHNKRALQLTESKIRRMERYYIRTKKLPADWHYRPELAEMLVT
jgi:small subunit ribosomal protein S15